MIDLKDNEHCEGFILLVDIMKRNPHILSEDKKNVRNVRISKTDGFDFVFQQGDKISDRWSLDCFIVD